MPISCQLSNEDEGTDLLGIRCIGSVRIEVIAVIYRENLSNHSELPTDLTDNQIQLVKQEGKQVVNEGPVKR